MHLLTWVLGLLYYITVPAAIAGGTRTSLSLHLASLHATGWGQLFLFRTPLKSYKWPSYKGKIVTGASLPVLAKAADRSYTSLFKTRPRSTTAGVALFVVGNLLQHVAHRQLAALREKPGMEDKYGQPSSWVFQLVSCPHYLAEIVLYSGLFTLLSPVTTWTVHGPIMLFIVANLACTAKQTHMWYRAKFQNYPKKRKALIPYIF